jgi:hypothetical protein
VGKANIWAGRVAECVRGFRQDFRMQWLNGIWFGFRRSPAAEWVWVSGREVEEESAVNVAWKNFCADAGSFCKPREIKGTRQAESAQFACSGSDWFLIWCRHGAVFLFSVCALRTVRTWVAGGSGSPGDEHPKGWTPSGRAALSITRPNQGTLWVCSVLTGMNGNSGRSLDRRSSIQPRVPFSGAGEIRPDRRAFGK